MQKDEKEINNGRQAIGDDEKITSLLSALPKVDAPGDFHTRVRARIAAGRPEERRSFRVPVAVRYAVPLLLLIAIGAYFGLTRFYSLNKLETPEVADVGPKTAGPAMSEPVNNVVTVPEPQIKDEQASVEPAVNRGVRTEAPVGRVSRDRSLVGGSVDSDGGSRDSTQHVIKKTLLPRGLNNDQQVPAGEVFNIIGVDAQFTGGVWKVRSVSEHSPAERSGLKAGDVVESVNDQNVSAKTSFPSPFTGKTLKVKRDGKDIHIDLKP